MEYTVWYRERYAHEWRTMKILSRGVTEATLVGLRSGKQHELRVLASDQLGDGLFSKPVFVWTTGLLVLSITPTKKVTQWLRKPGKRSDVWESISMSQKHFFSMIVKIMLSILLLLYMAFDHDVHHRRTPD